MKKIGLLMMPLMAISLLASCNGNSIKWISKSEFKKMINDYYISKPFEKYIGYSMTLEIEGGPSGTFEITRIVKSSDADIFGFANDTSTFMFSILSPDLVDCFDNGGDLKCAVIGENFIVNVSDFKYPEIFHDIVADLEMTYNTDMAIVHSVGKGKSDGKVISSMETNYIYKTKI